MTLSTALPLRAIMKRLRSLTFFVVVILTIATSLYSQTRPRRVTQTNNTPFETSSRSRVETPVEPGAERPVERPRNRVGPGSFWARRFQLAADDVVRRPEKYC